MQVFDLVNQNEVTLLNLEIKHFFCHFLMQNFTQNEKLRNFYKVLTTNTHADVEFISTMEGSYQCNM